ncbi:alpha/beta-type small acid-soluble spore protein [Brevibacillus sp. SYSU BS000544]|uniref:alpha/beta-type small acid-soluble spore protein n=1 Tax=Brevibacillus sp. SYSU BS000544 TaxID=3416443 RepID=UPI003CE45BF5
MSRRKPLVPEARNGLDQLKARVQQVSDPNQAKFEAASELHIPLEPGYNGNLTSHDAGRIGGKLGGSMVKEMIRSAQEQLAAKQQKQ